MLIKMVFRYLTPYGKRVLGGFLLVLFIVTLGVTTFAVWPEKELTPQEIAQLKLEHRMAISSALSPHLDSMIFPEQLSVDLEDGLNTYNVKYTIDNELQDTADTLLRRYKPDYGAVFMMDAETGEVLVYSSFQRDSEEPVNLIKRSSYPAASVFKIVTATTAVDKTGVSADHRIRFNGGNWTLYRRNVMRELQNRWTRSVTLKDAFAKSMNTAFGKVSLKLMEPQDLKDYSDRFLFNQFIPADFYVEPGQARVPDEKSFHLAEVASGYNRITRMGPVQGALIAASVVNNGKMVIPYIVNELQNEQGQRVYKGEKMTQSPVMSADSAKVVRELMTATVVKGTSRRTFRDFVRDKKLQHVKVGGKTGHLYGNDPRGTVDWFVGYASDKDRKVAIAAVLVNKKYWRVKSSYLSQRLFRKYFTPPTVQVSSNP